MVGGGPFGLEPGQWTDDASMALCLTDSLLARGRLDQADLMGRFVRWWREGENSATGRCFDVGRTTATALARYEATGDPAAGSTDPRTAGNGSPIRFIAASSSPFTGSPLRSLSEASIPARAFSRHASSRKISTPNSRDKGPTSVASAVENVDELRSPSFTTAPSTATSFSRFLVMIRSSLDASIKPIPCPRKSGPSHLYREYADATPFTVTLFHNGGTGARPAKDGLSATAFPSGVRNTPVEINEAIAPIVVRRKEYRTDSGGAGRA
jgi:hypothetical protein